MRRVIQMTFAGLLLLAGAHSANAVEIRENFEAYPVQLDTTGIFDASEATTVYFVTTDGSMPANLGDNAKVVAAAAEALAAGTGIADDAGKRVWVLNSAAGSTGSISGQNGHVLVADIGAGQPAGPLGAYFAGGAKDLTGATLSYDIRETTGNAPTTFRFLLIDAADNEIWTAPFSLTTAFETITVSMNDFTTILDGGVSFDFTQIIGVGLDVFTTPGSAPVLSFQIDNVTLELPVVEDFQAYPVQLDSTGLVVEQDPGVFETFFGVTSDGIPLSDPNDTSTLVAGMGQEALGASTGIVDNAGEKVWQINSSSGATGSISGQDGHVMVAVIGRFAGSGPIATLFNGGLLDLNGGTVSFDIRETTGAAATSFRFLLSSNNGEEIWSDPISLTAAFQTFTVTEDDFTTILDGGVSFNFSRVEEIGLDIFTTPSPTAPALSFEIDNFRVLAEPVPARVSDFDGDYRSDILWRNTSTGANRIWQLDGFAVTTNQSIAAVPTNWDVVGLGDSDGDRKVDILWRDGARGANRIWRMDGTTVAANQSISAVPPVWAVVGMADFGDDGKADILWRNTSSGANRIWQMDGFTVSANQSIGSVGTAWSVVGLGDFNDDGKADILWRNTTSGANRIWQMDGFTVTGNQSIGAVSTAWTVVGVGDFSGDGKADILWRNTSSGANRIWEMNGFTVTANQTTSAAPAVWDVEGLGEFVSGDGKADVLWRNSGSGATRIWEMDGTTVTDNQSIGAAGSPWEVQ